MANCEPGSEIYSDCINALQAVEELGRLTLDDARAAGNTTEPVIGRGRQAGGRQGQGGRRQSSQRPTSSRHRTSAQHATAGRRPTPVPTSGRHHTPVPISGRRHTPVRTSGRRHTPMHDHTMEEASQTEDEMCLDIGYDMGSMAHDDVGPSHMFAHGDASRSPSTSSTPTTRMSPPPTTSTAPADVRGRGDMRFMPTPGVVPLPTPPPEASHIEDRPRRPQRTWTHPPDCGTGHENDKESKTGLSASFFAPSAGRAFPEYKGSPILARVAVRVDVGASTESFQVRATMSIEIGIVRMKLPLVSFLYLLDIKSQFSGLKAGKRYGIITFPTPSLQRLRGTKIATVKVTGEFLTFPGGGTQFLKGALHYIHFVQQSLPDIAWGKRSPVLLDVGCGVASFGGFPLERDVLAMSFAPTDEHEAQVQFALERGIPAISSVMGTKRLPFPGAVFDVVHCARCRVPWHVEAIYRKSTSNECYDKRPKNEPPLYKESDDPNAACDTFNENSPPTNDPTYISLLGASVYKAMSKGDKDAVWLMQGWLFSSDSAFWKPPQMKFKVAVVHALETEMGMNLNQGGVEE
ncbi:hypothetical protein SO802_013771 [Lithocarpus litseifolius]|uniref:Methyltransferase n=1 Tax=Lithocarpus litseifolius TaxID=425828 RepID=A0AAW2D6J5_9ROSI